MNTSEKEGWGLTVLEANACGLPAIASDVPGLRDAVRDGEWCPGACMGDVNRLRAVLLRILQDDAYLRRLSAGARAWAQRFTWDAVVANLAEVIEAVAAGRVPRVDQWFDARPARRRSSSGGC